VLPQAVTAWLPFVVILVLYFALTRTWRQAALQRAERSLQLGEQMLAEQQRTNVLLEDIQAKLVEQRQ
jgi:hypothetical protein